mmetsp:Transcript_4009/g.11445  ORF Transcript_4009/g.11445 Transcript_4009/m.11445 type:complete len:298 (+) Transcript_4009:484-1377(+)
MRPIRCGPAQRLSQCDRCGGTCHRAAPTPGGSLAPPRPADPASRRLCCPLGHRLECCHRRCSLHCCSPHLGGAAAPGRTGARGRAPAWRGCSSRTPRAPRRTRTGSPPGWPIAQPEQGPPQLRSAKPRTQEARLQRRRCRRLHHGAWRRRDRGQLVAPSVPRACPRRPRQSAHCARCCAPRCAQRRRSPRRWRLRPARSRTGAQGTTQWCRCRSTCRVAAYRQCCSTYRATVHRRPERCRWRRHRRYHLHYFDQCHGRRHYGQSPAPQSSARRQRHRRSSRPQPGHVAGARRRRWRA